jgi:hypothetical protein
MKASGTSADYPTSRSLQGISQIQAGDRWHITIIDPSRKTCRVVEIRPVRSFRFLCCSGRPSDANNISVRETPAGHG